MLNWFSSDHVLALIAVVFGVVGIYYERTLHRRFKAQEKEIQKSFELQKEKIEQIVLSVHTSFIGKFPLDLEKTTELIKDSKDGDDLLILADFLGYGIYSDPVRYEQYVKALVDAKAKTRILIYDDAAAKTTMEMQFERDKFSECRESERFRNYLEHYKKLIKVEPTEYEEFLNGLLYVQDHFCQQLTAKAHIDVRSISSTSIREAVFFWMVNKKEMVFSFPNSYTRRKEFSFKTRDDHLMELFADQFEQKWAVGKEVQGKCYTSDKLFDVPAAVAQSTSGD